MSTPLFQNPEATSKVCFRGGILNPLVFYVTAIAACHAHNFILKAFMVVVAIQVLAQVFFVVCGLASLVNLPKEDRIAIVGRSLSGIIIGIGLGYFMFFFGILGILITHGGPG